MISVPYFLSLLRASAWDPWCVSFHHILCGTSVLRRPLHPQPLCWTCDVYACLCTTPTRRGGGGLMLHFTSKCKHSMQVISVCVVLINFHSFHCEQVEPPQSQWWLSIYMYISHMFWSWRAPYTCNEQNGLNMQRLTEGRRMRWDIIEN